MKYFICLILITLLIQNMAAERGNVWASGRYKIGVEGNKIVIING